MKRTLFAGVAMTALVVVTNSVSAQTNQSTGDKPPASSVTSSSSSSTKPDGATGKSESAPGQTKPNASTSAAGKSETAPGQTKPDAITSAPGKSDSAPGQSKPETSTAKPADTKPADMKPATGNTTAKPAETKTPDTKTTDTKPASGGAATGATGTTGGNTGNATSGSTSSSSSSAASSSSVSSTNVNLNAEQQTKVTQAFSSVNVQPVTNVNFSVSVGTVIDQQVTLHDLPPAIVQVVPQFRGYRYIVVRDQIVIVEPRTKKIVYVMSRSGGSKRSSLSISSDKRSMVKKSLASGPKITKTLKVEEDMVVPQDIELSTVSETVVSDLPELRSYRYFVIEDQVVIVEPETRRVIEIIR